MLEDVKQDAVQSRPGVKGGDGWRTLRSGIPGYWTSSSEDGHKVVDMVHHGAMQH